MMTPDELISALDKKYAKTVDVYRAALGQWVVRVPGRDITGATIQQALEVALTYVPLPQYPRQPHVYHPGDYVAVKYGSKWKITTLSGAQDLAGNFRTKSEAEGWLNRMCNQSLNTWRDWMNDVKPLTDGKIAGVDFEWTS